ncbi:hypothetical protein MNAN1_000619 [Malassezia nana]|uniref:SET domain-containing protein n=1 Tax=Malassezia nana TaxID=180528 RepID=A0AAF0EJC0_9BASI|nr:hypothetical protein MNAN1_000619 [Malassezia nana]
MAPLCVLYEQSLARLSAFDVYFHYCHPVSLPSTDKTWGNDPYFVYTEAWYRMKRRTHAYQQCLDYPGTCLQELHDFWHTYGEPVLEHMLEATPTLDQFLLAFSLVSSRAFVIDVFHGLCLVPVADLFNHSAPNNVQVESDSDVCIQCGSVQHAHCSSPMSDGATGYVDIRCTDTIEEGDEAMNSYGDLGNAELVCQYGFSLPFKTGWDRCSWDVRMPCERRQVASLLRVPESLLGEDLTKLEPGIMSEFQRQHIEDGIPPSYEEQGAVYDMAPLSHPHDPICPLFVDGYGRASWPLWRLCLFSDTLILHMDDILHEPKLPAWEYDWALTHKPSVNARVAAACAALQRMCEDRIQRLYISSHEQEAMEELEGPAHPVRRSAMYHALQDMDMLRACYSRYAPCPD